MHCSAEGFLGLKCCQWKRCSCQGNEVEMAASKAFAALLARAFFALACRNSAPHFAGHSNFILPHSTTFLDTTTAIMAPKKKVERGAQENISLGPQVREGIRLSQSSDPTRSITDIRFSRRARLRRCTHLRLVQRHLRPCHRSLVRLKNKQPKKSCINTHNMRHEMVHRLTWVIPAAAKPSLA